MRFGCSKSSPGSGRTPVPTIPSQEFSTHIRYVEDEVVVEARGDLDAWSGPALQETVRQLLDEGTRRLAVDLAEAPFVDSTGLGALVWAYHRCEESGCVLRIVNPGPSTLRLLTLTGLERVLPVFIGGT